MTLKTRLYLLICFLILGSVFVQHLAARYVLEGGFNNIERQTIKSKLANAQAEILDREHALQLQTLDDAQWDETYRFILGKNPDYLKVNFQPSYLNKLNIDFLLISDGSKKVIGAVSAGSNSPRISRLPASINITLQRFGATTIGKKLSGIFGADHKVYIFSSMPVVHSEGHGPAVGQFIFVRELDDKILAAMSQLVNAGVFLRTIDTATSDIPAADLKSLISGTCKVLITTPSRKYADAFTVMNDPDGNPTAILHIHSDRQVPAQARRSSSYLLLTSILFIVVFGIITQILSNKTVFRRLAKMNTELQAIEQGDSALRLSREGSDEIASVAMVLNSTLDKLQETQNDLMQERERLAVTLASIGDAVIATDQNGIITFLNNVAEAILGCSSDKAVGCKAADVLVLKNEDTREVVVNPANIAIETHQVASLPSGTILVRKDGTAIPIDDAAAPIIDSNGKLIGAIMVFRDVTAQRLAEAQIIDSNERLNTLWESIYAGVVIIDAETNEIVDANNVAQKMLGFTKDEIIGKTCYNTICTSEKARCRAANSDKDRIEGIECKLVTKNGTKIDILKTVVKINLDERPYLLESFVDISDRKRAEGELCRTATALEQTLERNRVIFENSAVGVLATDENDRITEINPKCAQLFGYDPQELVGCGINTFFTSYDDYLSIRQNSRFDLSTNGYWFIEGTFKRKDGSFIFCEVSGTAFDSSDLSKGVIYVVLDVTEKRKALQALEINQYAMDKASDFITRIDKDGNLNYVNEALCDALGYSNKELLGMNIWEITSDKEEKNWTSKWQQIKDLSHLNFTITGKTKSGNTLPLDISASYHEFGDNQYVFSYARDISSKLKNEEQMKIQVSAINAATDLVVIFSANGNIAFVNKAFLENTGYDESDLLGMHFDILSVGQVQEPSSESLWKIIASDKSWSGERVINKKNSDRFFIECTITPVSNDDATISHYIAIGRDVTERKTYEEKLNYLARHDALTGLPNRLTFNETLETLVNGKRVSDSQFAVLFIDLDNFKMVNDTLGHEAGDDLLIETGRRLRNCIREYDLLSRMGGDEFTIILRNLTNVSDTRIVANRILRTIGMPFSIQGHEFNVYASIGVSVFPTNGTDVSTIVKCADRAMYKAKELGRNNAQYYEPEMDAENIEQLRMERELRIALDNSELDVFYQPQIDPVSRELVGAQSIIQWNHPTRGIIEPEKFIRLAEENGLIIRLGEYILKTVLNQIREWRKLGCNPVNIAVGLSEKHILRPDFLGNIEQLLMEYDVEATSLSLELSGKAYLRMSDQATNIVNSLRKSGISVILDDFSTGPMPLTHLSRIPVDALKIDSSLMASASERDEDIGIAAAIASTARNLKLQVIAVGIENEELLNLTSSLMFDSVQGSYISKPLNALDFQKYAAGERQLKFEDEAA